MLQVIGFAVLVYGTLCVSLVCSAKLFAKFTMLTCSVFNDILRFPSFCYGASEPLPAASQPRRTEEARRSHSRSRSSASEDTPLLS